MRQLEGRCELNPLIPRHFFMVDFRTNKTFLYTQNIRPAVGESMNCYSSDVVQPKSEDEVLGTMKESFSEETEILQTVGEN